MVYTLYSQPMDIIKVVPQGSVLGPVIFKVFTNDLFATLNRSLLTNYTDNVTITVIQNSKGDLIRTLRSESELAISWFKDNEMEANPSKFQPIILTAKDTVTIEICDNIVFSEENVTLLSVILDKNRNFNDHTKMLCRKAASQLAVLQRLSNCLDFGARMAIFRCFILSHFNYCNLVWHFCGATNTARLERLQCRALKFVFQDWNSSYEDLLKKSSCLHLNWQENVQLYWKCIRLREVSPLALCGTFLLQRKANTICVKLISYV